MLPAGVPDSLPIRRFVAKSPATATIDVDAQGRLRKILVEPDNPTPPLPGDSSGGIVFQPVYATWSLELWDFVFEADFTDSRCPNDVVELDEDSRAQAILEGDASERGLSADDLDPVGTGTWESVTWTMRTGVNDAGDTCASFVLDPNDGTDWINTTPECFASLDRTMPFEVVRNSEAEDPFWFVAACSLHPRSTSSTSRWLMAPSLPSRSTRTITPLCSSTVSRSTSTRSTSCSTTARPRTATSAFDDSGYFISWSERW